MIDKYKHIIWDWNGTLLNDVELCVDIINNILLKHKLECLSLGKYRDIFTFPVRDYYALAGLDLQRNSFDLLGMEWMNEYEMRKSSCSLFPGTEKILESAKNSGKEQSLLSAYRHDTLIKILDQLNLAKYFKYITGLDHIYATSKIENARILMESISLPPDEVVLIGDTLHDFETAKDIGTDCILVSNGHQSKQKLLSAGVPVIATISELLVKKGGAIII